MNSLKLFAATSVLFALPAMAIPTSTTTTTKAPVLTTPAAPAGAPTVPVVASTSTTTTKAVAPKAKWGADALMWAFQTADLVNHGKTTYGSYNTLGLSYKFANGHKFGARQIIEGTWGDPKDPMVGKDAYVYWSKGGVSLPWDVKLVNQARIYAPLSKASREKEQIQTRYYATLDKEFKGGWTLEYLANPRYFYVGKHQSADNTAGNSQALFVQYIQISKALGNFTFSHNFGTNHYFKYDPSENYSDSWTMSTGVDYNITDTVSVSLSVDSERSMSSNAGSWTPYNDTAETNYNVILSASM
jgi:hypothetical protein